MPVCKKCGQYYVREPCPTCGYSPSLDVATTPEPVFEETTPPATIPVAPSPIKHETVSASASESPTQASSESEQSSAPPAREKPPIDTGIDPLEVENRKLKTELEIAKRELQGYKEKVKDAITKIDRILRDLDR